jgi:prephenate dehydrogenase
VRSRPDARRIASRPAFSSVAIVGVGLMGGSLALALRRAWPGVAVFGVDRQAVVERAQEQGAIHYGAEDLWLVAGADLIVLAAPAATNIELLSALLPHAAPDAVITDVGSVKRRIMAAAEQLPVNFVGGHPVCGGTSSGLSAANPDMFAGRQWLLTAGSRTHRDALERVLAMARAVGARPRVVDASEHDRLMAYVSHLPQLVSSMLMRAAGEAVGDHGLSLAGAGLLDTTRLAASTASIWEDICRENGDEIAPALDRMIGLLVELRTSVGTRAPLGLFDEASRWRRRLEELGEIASAGKV